MYNNFTNTDSNVLRILGLKALVVNGTVHQREI